MSGVEVRKLAEKKTASQPKSNETKVVKVHETVRKVLNDLTLIAKFISAGVGAVIAIKCACDAFNAGGTDSDNHQD